MSSAWHSRCLFMFLLFFSRPRCMVCHVYLQLHLPALQMGVPPHIVLGTFWTGARPHRRVAARARMDGACVRTFWRMEDIEDHSPSRKEGVPRAVEALCRRAACQLVIDTGARLKLCVATHVASRICGEEKVADRGIDVLQQAAADHRHVHRVLPGVLRQAILARTRPSCASQRFARTRTRGCVEKTEC